MPYVYKYVDKADGICKYVGIVKGDIDSLKRRIYQHKRDGWHKNRCFSVSYFQCNTQSEAEAFESHLIAEYGTANYFNKAKSGWGENQFLSFVSIIWSPIDDDSVWEINAKRESLAEARERHNRELNFNASESRSWQLITECEMQMKKHNSENPSFLYKKCMRHIENRLSDMRGHHDKNAFLAILRLWGASIKMILHEYGLKTLSQLIADEKENEICGKHSVQNILNGLLDYFDSDSDDELIITATKSIPYDIWIE